VCNPLEVSAGRQPVNTGVRVVAYPDLCRMLSYSSNRLCQPVNSSRLDLTPNREIVSTVFRATNLYRLRLLVSVSRPASGESKSGKLVGERGIEINE